MDHESTCVHGVESGDEIKNHASGVVGELSRVTIARQRMEDASSLMSTAQESLLCYLASHPRTHKRRYTSVPHAGLAGGHCSYVLSFP